jgi:hypothetical protein
MKNCVFWVLRRVALVRTDVSEELSASFFRGTRIGELGTTLAETSNRRTLRRFLRSVRRFLQEPHGVTSQTTLSFGATISCKNRRFGGTWRLLHQGDKNR